MNWRGWRLLLLLPRAPALTFRQAEQQANTERSLERGPFQPNWESLKQYKAPDWSAMQISDLGHWTARCVLVQGDYPSH